jgi:hypothetical protein
MIMAGMIEHRVRTEDPLAIPGADWEEDAITAQLDPAPVSLERASQLVSA